MTTAEIPLTPETGSQLREIGEVDLLVGIPSYNNATTIGHVVETAAAGLVRHFPGLRPVIFNGDGGSPDGTPAAVLGARVPAEVQVLSFPYLGLPGKGSAFTFTINGQYVAKPSEDDQRPGRMVA